LCLSPGRSDNRGPGPGQPKGHATPQAPVPHGHNRDFAVQLKQLHHLSSSLFPLPPTRLLTIVVRAVVYIRRGAYLARDAWEYTIANARALWRRENYLMLTGEIDGYLTFYDVDDFFEHLKETELVLLYHGMVRTAAVSYG